MSDTITITGYEPGPEVYCDHCGRHLVHGIRIDDGRTVGATCLANKLTAKLVYNGKGYRLPADKIVHMAKVVERVAPHARERYGINDRCITFPKAVAA